MIAGLGALVLHTSLKQADSQRPEMSELRRAESRSDPMRSQSNPRLSWCEGHTDTFTAGDRHRQAAAGQTHCARIYEIQFGLCVGRAGTKIIHIERFIAHTHIVTVRAVK